MAAGPEGPEPGARHPGGRAGSRGGRAAAQPWVAAALLPALVKCDLETGEVRSWFGFLPGGAACSMFDLELRQPAC